MTLQTEQLIADRYCLKQSLGKKIGRETWLAEDLGQEGRPLVVLKMLPFTSQTQWEEVKLFEREAQVLKNLDHPRIPKYLDSLTLEETPEQLPCFVLVQSYIPGTSLQETLQQGVTLREGQAHQLAREILEILIYLHELSPPVFHRDIKPSNIIWGNDRQFYLVDFGAVQDRAKAEGVTFTVVGTGGYAPPEQLWGRAVPSSDLYALSATLVHLLTGVAPAELPQKRMRIQFRENAEGQLKGGVTIAPGFADWLDILLDPAADRRLSSARKALEALSASFSSKTSSESTALPKGAYASLGSWAISQYAVGILLAILLPSFAVYVSKAGRAEGRQLIGSMNRAQQAYFLENNRFTSDLPSLGIGIQSDTKFYQYRLIANPLVSYHYAYPRESRLEPLVGGVFVTTEYRESGVTTLSLTCENATDGGDIKPEPQLIGHSIQCPPGATKLQYPQPALIVNSDVVLAHRALEILRQGEQDQAIQIADSIENPDLEALVWQEISKQSSHWLKNLDQRQKLPDALQVAAKISDPYINSLVKGNIARRAIQAKNSKLGLQLINEAIAGSKGIRDEESKTRALIYLSGVAKELPNPDTARHLLQQALLQTEQILTPELQVALYQTLAEQFGDLSDYKQATQLLNQGAAITKEVHDLSERVMLQQRLALEGLRVIQQAQQHHYRKTGRFAPSLEVLELPEIALEKMFRYSITVTPQAVFTQLQDIENLNSYGYPQVGAVFQVKKSAANPSGLITIMCQKKSAVTGSMTRPTVSQGVAKCAADTVQIQ